MSGEKDQQNVKTIVKRYPTRMGFEPTRAEPIGLAVQRLNHSATSSLQLWSQFESGDHHTTNQYSLESQISCAFMKKSSHAGS